MSVSTVSPVIIDGQSLSLESVARVAFDRAEVVLDKEAARRIEAARQVVDTAASGEAAVYGVNTGFGTLAEVRIAKDDLARLQKNLIHSHAAGVGNPLSPPEARALMLLRANVLAKGHSGIRLSTVRLVIDALNRGLVPVVPERGSVGASGDLAPLAHLALALIGDGEFFLDGERLPARVALERVGLTPCVLEAKEGLALVNGTQAICAVGSLACLRAEKLCRLADLAGAMTLEGLLGSHRPFTDKLHTARPHPGQSAAARHLRELLRHSELVETHRHCKKVQDPYSLRCMPQVHGASRDGVAFARRALDIEINSATDNPLVFADTAEMISGGNFHGQPVSLALDVLAMSATQLASISERRVEQLVNPALSGLPAFLAPDSGLNSGFMIAQVTAAALVVESRILCHPACVDSIPSSAGREDHVSMGMTAALKARQVMDFVRTVLAIELLVAAQALDFQHPKGKAGEGVEKAFERIRAEVPFMAEDRELHRDIRALETMIDHGDFDDL
ncbi:MAG: histidine ammonia-lyase [Myxococcaceae bacterium]|nr:histidine ammonia-lyase [Myxococcaceae bacterium]